MDEVLDYDETQTPGTDVAVPEMAVAYPVRDPSQGSWPPLFPIELALGDAKPKDICATYSITKERFAQLTQLPAFQKAYADAQMMLAKDGMAFRTKARIQGEELLKTAFSLIHAPHTPSNVKADLIKAIWKMGGYEPKEGTTPQHPLLINIQL